jgi:DNA polymerase-3 subunit alpha
MNWILYKKKYLGRSLGFMDNYVVTHLHSDLSNGVTNIDSVTKFDDYILKAKECGMKALCFTEHGSVFSWVNKKKHIEDAGMKYIHGIEAYVTESLDKKERDNYHCVLIATNYEAVKEINKLSSISFNRNDGHFYYAPRITFDELINTSDNIIIQTACLGGILHNGNDNLKNKFIKFITKNKHRCYLEIQHHNVEDQIKYNKYLYKLSKEIGVPLI